MLFPGIPDFPLSRKGRVQADLSQEPQGREAGGRGGKPAAGPGPGRRLRSREDPGTPGGAGVHSPGTSGCYGGDRDLMPWKTPLEHGFWGR